MEENIDTGNRGKGVFVDLHSSFVYFIQRWLVSNINAIVYYNSNHYLVTFDRTATFEIIKLQKCLNRLLRLNLYYLWRMGSNTNMQYKMQRLSSLTQYSGY